jgi:hypothetical protein
MIGLEFLIGFLLIFGLYIKRFSIKLTIASLILFSIYLVFIILAAATMVIVVVLEQAIVMTPLQALIKNAIMLVASFFIYKYYEGFNFGKIGKWLLSALIIFSFALPHILNYVDFDYSEAYLTKKEDSFKLELDSVYKDAKIHTPPKSLSKGKHIIAFMSMSCPIVE